MIADQIQLERDGEEGLARQLFLQIRRLIEGGGLTAGTALPASRRFAQELGVGRNTVIMAYEQLVLEGYAQADGRRGTRISEASRGFIGHNSGRDGHLLDGREPHLSRQAARLMSVKRRDMPTPATFQPGLPEIRHFPHDVWGRLLRRAARQAHGHEALMGYGHYTGWPALKEAILAHVAVSRGVVADVDQIFILSSAQACLDLITRLLLDPGDDVLHEEPGYGGMLVSLRAVEARCHPLDVEAKGAYASLEETMGKERAPRLIYATPSHQFPSGRVMTLKDRLALLSYAGQEDAFVLEDDYDSEFHFSGDPISCLQGLDRQDLVIYMGTFAKSLMPAMHVAYLIVPRRLVEPVRRGVRSVGAVPPFVIQQALADFLGEGHFRSHLREMGQLYQERRDVLVAALEAHCGQYLVPVVPEGGIQLPAYFTDFALSKGLDDRRVMASLQQAGVESSALSTLYWSGQSEARQGLFLGYAASSPVEIEQGVETIGGLFKAKVS